MGTKLVKAFDLAKEHGGVQSELRLAMKSGTTRQRAEREDDSPEKIEKMQHALKEIIGQAVTL